MTQSPTIRVRALRCGSVFMPRAAACGSRFYLPAAKAMTPAREREERPVNCFLIEHPKGRLLFDAGLSRELSPAGVYSAGDAAGVMTAPLAAFYRPTVPPGEAIDERLAALGLRPSDIDWVLLSHLDADHVCGLSRLWEARHIMCSQEDYWWSSRTVYRLRQPRSLWLSDRLETFWFKGTDIGPFIWSYDFFGDGSLILLHFPGHTDGQFGALLRGSSGFALLTADAAFDRRSWEELRIPGYGFNPEAQLKCLRYIQQRSRESDCAAVLASHDPEASRADIVL